jgi:hypothetical protein
MQNACTSSLLTQGAAVNLDGDTGQSHLDRPGPQAHNQVGTLHESLARVHAPRPTPEQAARASLVGLVESVVRRTLVEELPAAVKYIMTSRSRE